MKNYWLFILLIFTIACSKSNEVVIPNNIAPPDSTIENVVYEDYVNRSYILICGRKPDSTELDYSLNILKPSLFSLNSRSQFLNSVFLKPDYRPHIYDKWRNELLNNLDTVDITNQIFIFNFYLNDTTFQQFWPSLQFELNRLQLLQSASSLYISKQISIRELQLRMIDNYFYDQINMGASNFVLTCFQHFLGRNPTNDELNSGISMVNGSNAILFLKAGSSKDEFLNIFFNANDYYEGSIIRLYNDFLFHNPTSLQMTVASQKYKTSGNYEESQIEIMSTDEFAGIK